MTKVIEINNLSKVYDLGLVGTGTLSKDLNRTWAKLRGKPDPYSTLTELNDRTQKSSSNTVYALKDIDFSVDKGEVLGIIGKNGAGKSTLLKILSQITSPSTGNIKMKGRVASLLEVGTGMHPEMTARQNIYLNGSLMGMRRQEISSKLDEIIFFAGIEKYIDTPIKRFSSGMTVRLGFAIAAFLEPEILIVDEVLAVGDAEFQKKAVGKMQDVSNAEGRTVLFVSHDMNSINSLCKRVVVLENGMVKAIENTQKAVELYLEGSNKSFTMKNNQFIGDEYYSLEGVKILNNFKKETKFFDIHENNYIEIKINVLQTGMNGIPNIHFRSIKGDYVFNSAKELNILNQKTGKFKLELEIPKNILNAITYKIDIGLTTMAPFKIHFLEKESVFIECMENINNRTEGHNQKIEGLIRPKLNWTINKIE